MRSFRYLSIAIFFTSLIPCSPRCFAAGAQPSLHAVLESIEGGKTVTLMRGGKKKDVGKGVGIFPGESIQTGPKVSAVLRYPDESKVMIAFDTQYQVEELEEGTQWNRLKYGSVRGIIQKAVNADSHKPKFLIRTKSAVIGVRGTDFVMSQPIKGAAQVHTLEGVVDVGKDPLTVMSGKGVPLTEGQFVTSIPGGISTPESFNTKNYLDQLNSESFGSPSASKPSTGSANTPSPPTRTTVPDSKGPPPTHFPNLNANADTDPTHGDDIGQQKEGEPKRQDPPEFKPLYIKNEVEPDPNKLKIINFQFGTFFAKTQDGTIIRAFNATWTPSVPFPVLKMLSLRGNLGGSFAQNGSINNQFWVLDAQVLINLSIQSLFVEAGVGWQSWRSVISYNDTVVAIHAGLNFRFGPIDRLIFGMTRGISSSSFDEYQAGVGIGF